MEDKVQLLADAAEQAIHDRSIIDHVVHAFSFEREEEPMRPVMRFQSAEVYHQIRRTWANRR